MLFNFTACKWCLCGRRVILTEFTKIGCEVLTQVPVDYHNYTVLQVLKLLLWNLPGDYYHQIPMGYLIIKVGTTQGG